MFIVNFIAAIVLFLLGLYGVVMHRNMVRILLSLGLMESATYLMLLSIGYRQGGTAPIFYEAKIIPGATLAVDPIMQALALTSIVIGVATLALAMSLIIQLVRHHRTLDIRRIRDLRG